MSRPGRQPRRKGFPAPGDPFEYQVNPRFFAQIAGGMEEMGVEELTELGAANVEPAYRGMYFTAGPETLYRICLSSRLVTRVLAPLRRFDCPDIEHLRDGAATIDWPALFGPDLTFAIFANVGNSRIRHSQFALQNLKDVIVDRFKYQVFRRPSVNRDNPDIWFNLHIENDKAIIGLDVTGGSLHRRGYRKRTGEAPMQETLAAAIVRLSEWHGSMPLLDPMCGSGTLLAEAFMHATRMPSAYLRTRFGFEFLPDFDSAAWERVRAEGRGSLRTNVDLTIHGSDVDRSMIAASRANLRNLPGAAQAIKLKVMDFHDLPEQPPSVIISNPPYGERLGEKATVMALIRDFGDFLKQKCTGSTAFIYFGDRELIPELGLRTTWKKPLVNGALDGRLVKVELY